MRTISPLTAAVALSGLFWTGSAATAQSLQHLDRLAGILEWQTRNVHRELFAHYRFVPQFRHLDRDLRQMSRQTNQIRAMIQGRAGVRHMRSEVRELDRLFHHIEELVNDLPRYRTGDPQAARRLRSSLRTMENTLHHMQDDLRRLERGDGDNGWWWGW